MQSIPAGDVVLRSPPIVPTMIADPVVVADVATANLALVEPAGTVTLAGTVAMWGESFVRSATTPPTVRPTTA